MICFYVFKIFFHPRDHSLKLIERCFVAIISICSGIVIRLNHDDDNQLYFHAVFVEYEAIY